MDMIPLPRADELLSDLRSRGIELPAGRVSVDAYGDSPELSEELLALIRAGRKRAGTSLLWAHEAEAQPLPEVGDVQIVVDHLNEPVLITRVASVDVLPFNEVSAAYAAVEGEGDGSLDHWRRVHWAFFGRECDRLGVSPVETMPVVCSVFEVIHVLEHQDAARKATPSMPGNGAARHPMDG